MKLTSLLWEIFRFLKYVLGYFLPVANRGEMTGNEGKERGGGCNPGLGPDSYPVPPGHTTLESLSIKKRWSASLNWRGIGQ